MEYSYSITEYEFTMEADIPSVGHAYLKYYKLQQGGGLSDITVYRRTKVRQGGDGIGDILRGIARFLLPLIFRGAQTFTDETFRNTDKGMTFGAAAKSALHPTVSAVFDQASGQFQRGRGKKRRRSKKLRTKLSSSERVQAGSGKIMKQKKNRVYKGDSFGKRQSQVGSGKRKSQGGSGKRKSQGGSRKRKSQVGSGKTKKRTAKKRKQSTREAHSDSYNF